MIAMIGIKRRTLKWFVLESSIVLLSFGSKATAKWTDFHRLSLSPCFPAFSSGLTGDSPKRGYLLRFCGSAKLYAVASEGRWAITVVEFCAESKFLRLCCFLFSAHELGLASSIMTSFWKFKIKDFVTAKRTQDRSIFYFIMPKFDYKLFVNLLHVL